MNKRSLSLLFLTALLIAALSIQSASGAHLGVYRGKTAQKLSIQLSASKGKITLIRFKVKMLCRDGSLLYGDLSDFEASPLKPNGRFSDTQYGPTDTVSWSGHLHAKKVSGTLEVKDRLEGGVRCDSGAVGFEVGRG